MYAIGRAKEPRGWRVRLHRAIWDEVHSLCEYAQPRSRAVRRDLANFGAFGFASISYEDVGWAKV
jgi:hypothetical protein